MLKHLLLLVFLSFSMCQYQSVSFSNHDFREELLTQLRVVRARMPIRVYYDSSDEPDLEHVKKILDGFIARCSNEIGLDITVLSFEPLEGLVEKNAHEIRTLANKKHSDSQDEWILCFTKTIAPFRRFVIVENPIDNTTTVSCKIEQAYGFCCKVNKSITLYNFEEQYNTGDQTGQNVAMNCITHEFGHRLGLKHNPNICSVMLEVAGQGYGQWTDEDLYFLVRNRNPKWHCDFK